MMSGCLRVGRALLIGGAGFIGAHLARELLARGHEVVVLDDDRNYLAGGERAAAPCAGALGRPFLARQVAAVAVEHHDLLAARQQLPGQVRADEPGAPDEESASHAEAS
jgi:nucleoside-diphosphate-sugar epimerase